MMTQTSPAVAYESGEQPDEEIIRHVLDGNTAIFELLMRRYNERVYRAARAIVRDEQEAEDVMQQAYINAFMHLRQFSGAARFSTWLTRIAVNESLARVRRRGRYEAAGTDHRAAPVTIVPGQRTASKNRIEAQRIFLVVAEVERDQQ